MRTFTLPFSMLFSLALQSWKWQTEYCVCRPAPFSSRIFIPTHLFPPLLDTEPAAWLPPPPLLLLFLLLSSWGWGEGRGGSGGQTELETLENQRGSNFFNSANVVFTWIVKMGMQISGKQINVLHTFSGIFFTSNNNMVILPQNLKKLDNSDFKYPISRTK